MTDVELIELRYSGKAGAFLSGERRHPIPCRHGRHDPLAFVVLALPQVGGISGLQAKLEGWVFEFTPAVGSSEPTVGVAEAAAGGVLSLTVSAFVAYIFVQWWAWWYPGSEPLFYIVGGTTVCWLLATFLTRPVDHEHLVRFYRLIRSGGIGRRKYQREIPDVEVDSGYGRLFPDWLLGVILIYGALFGVGKLVFGSTMLGLLILAVGAAAAALLYGDLARFGAGSP